MSTFALAQRGVIQATAADGAGPKTATLATPVKLGSSFVTSSIKEQRLQALHAVQRGQRQLTNADTSPVDITITDVGDVAASHVNINHEDYRPTNPNIRGVRARLLDATTLRLEFAALAATETIDLNWEVITAKPTIRRGATVRLSAVDTVELAWDGTLAGAETVDGAWEVWDIENLGDDIKELLYRGQLTLGYLGENKVQDKIAFANEGYMMTYRMRIFDSETNASNATPDTDDPLETGEIARVDVTQSVNVGRNDRTYLEMVLTDKAATPGIG